MKNFLISAILVASLSGCLSAPKQLNIQEDAPQTIERAANDIADGVAASRWEGVTSVMVSLDNKLLATGFSTDVTIETKHDIRSATKSITAILVGELLEDEELVSVDQTIASLVPGRFKTFGQNDARRKITVRDILTMRTGLACDDWVPASIGHEDKMYQTNDWVSFLLEQPMAHERGQHFSYCTGGVVLMGEVIETLSERSISEFANQRLFQPLAIEDAEWAMTPSGGTDTGGHLELTAEGFHKVGQLIASQGIWNGETIIDRVWLSDMTDNQSDVYERRATYGYLWWRDRLQIESGSVDYIYAHGNGGNFIFVVPDERLVVSFTGVNFGSRLQFQPLQIFQEQLLPYLLGETSSKAR